MSTLKTIIRKWVRKHKLLRNVLRKLYRAGQYYAAWALGKFRQDKFQILYVNPNDITCTVSSDDDTLKGNAVWHFGSVSAGDWDLNGISLREHGDVYTILNQRLNQGIDFADIPEFIAHEREIERGAIIDSCTTRHEYVDRWHSIENLYHAIRDGSYKTQAELGTDNSLDEIRIQIGRKGALLFEEGLHRLVIAQLLNLEQVPVIVTRRHAEWAKLRSKVIKIAVQRGFIHQTFNHPDLDGIPRLYGNELHDKAMYGDDRWGFIVDSLPVTTGSVLDIGSYFGYFAHRFEALGFECYAVEPDQENLAVLTHYRQMMEKEFTVWEKSLFDINQFEFDIVLALNIFHHLIKARHDYEQLVEFLGKIRCQAMYFEPQQNSQAAYKSFTDEEFIDFVISNSVLNHSRLLGRAKEGRDVYLLTV
ncbi:MAG: hypothetical protein GY832_00670 [Chloroflexi bacterium]|nr:hypothetical protein [Chloroflexota bacterium]